MKKIKPFIALLLIAVILFSLSGCIKFDFSKSEKEDTTATNTALNTVTYDTPAYIDTPTQNNTQTFVSPSDTQTTPTPAPSYSSEPNHTISETVTTTEATPTTTEAVPTTTEAPVITENGVATYTAEYDGNKQIVFYPQSILEDNYTYPAVIFANGTGFDYKIYEKLLAKFAESGYIVVANDETMAADGSAQISSLNFIISENSNTDSVLFSKINTEKVAAAGHSQGGRSAVNAAAKDARFDCVLSIAGSNYIEEAEILRTPALFMAGTKDLIVNADKWVKPAYEVAKGPAVYASLVDGTHTTCCTNPETYVNYTTDWFDLWLKNNTDASATFKNGGALATDGAWTDFSCKSL